MKLILGPPPESSSHARDDDFQEMIGDISAWIDLTVSQAALVREAAGRISSQDRALAVAYYGREDVEKLEKDEPERVCREGLKWLDDRSAKTHASPFLALTEPLQIEIVQSSIGGCSAGDRENAGATFLSYLTRMVVRGFYTSRLGLNELAYKGNSFSVECPGRKPE